MDVAAGSESSGDRERTRRKSDVARYVVGVAAAADGVEALEHMFDTMPDHSGMEFAIMPDGGLVVAAPPVQCASFDAMPRPAVDTGLGDAVVGPSQHPEILYRSQEHPCPDQPEQAGQSLAIESGTDRRQQATNEELVASNEELQSTNLELHSVNQELYTLNAEYQQKISELTELTNDVNNLLVSTEVHTLFLDGNLCIRKFTPKMAEVFNLIPHDVGRRIDAFAHSVTCDDLIAKVSQVLDVGEQYEQRVQDHHDHHFLMRVLPYRVGEETCGVVLTLINISSLVAAQETVIQEREQLERVIAANRDGIWDWPDVTQDDMWWSPGCYQLLGYAPGEFPARYSEWLRLIHPEDRQRVLETSVPAQIQCYVDLHRDFEYRMRHKSGEYCWYRHRAIVDYNSSGTPSRMTGSVGDVHDRKCAEMQNIEEIRRRDNFLAMLSHELRNPMGAVLNAIEWLKASSERQPGAQHLPWGETIAANEPADVSDHTAVRVIERQTKHMARLLDDLLDVTRFGQSKMELRKEIIDLSALAEDVLEAVQYEFEAKHQKLTTMIGDMPLNVLADPARIKQAQVNLLTNASKYTPDAGEISYHLEQDGHAAVITVRDAGEGIPSDLLDSIFDLFVQSETTLSSIVRRYWSRPVARPQYRTRSRGEYCGRERWTGKRKRISDSPAARRAGTENPSACPALLVSRMQVVVGRR